MRSRMLPAMVFAANLARAAFRIAPLNARDANSIIKETKCYSLLKGIRGEPSADIAALETILRVSQLVWDYPEIADMDINPILVYNEGDGCQTLDVKISLNS